jgi:hypothetical protein
MRSAVRSWIICWVVSVNLCITHSTVFGDTDSVPASQDPAVVAGNWKVLKENKDPNHHAWTSYSRVVPGSSSKEFKITGTLHVPPANAVAALREMTVNSKEYIKESEGFIDVLSIDEKQVLVYSVFYMPLMFKDRGMCERFVFSEGESGSHRIVWKQEWDSCQPPQEKIVRMPVARGSWEFSPLANNKSKATYIVHAEPGGNFPAWMFNSAVKKGLPKELEKIERVAKSIMNDAAPEFGMNESAE